MIHRTWFGYLLRPIAALLAVALLSGCATQKVRFTSLPPGAMVTVGKKQGVTPCTLRVAKEEGPAVFRLSSGEERVLQLHGLDSHAEEVAEASGKVLGGTLMVTGGAVAGVGLLVLVVVTALDGDSEDERWLSAEQDDDNDEILGYSAALLLIGGLVFALGKWIYPDEQEAVFHVNFRDTAEAGPEEESLYEDVGYGAQRLKKATP